MEQTINRYQSPYRTRSSKNYNGDKLLKHWYKFVKQTIISGAILGVLFFCENVEVIAESGVWNKATEFVQSDISVEQVKNGLSWGLEYIKLSAPDVFSNSESIQASSVVNNEVNEVKEDIIETQKVVVDPTEGMTQEEKDIYNILSSTTILRPVNADITSEFGDRVDPITKKYTLHTGTDFGVVIGTQVKSAITGTVIETKKSNVSLGNYVKIKNADIVTTYAHCSTLKVKEGDKVKQGDVIALSGNSGKSSGPHLHFEVIKDGRYINPEKVMLPLEENV